MHKCIHKDSQRVIVGEGLEGAIIFMLVVFWIFFLWIILGKL